MAVLLGQSGAGTNTANSGSAGIGEATQYTALASGVIDTVQFFFRTGNTCTNVRFAIYTDNANEPGNRIGAEQVLASPTANADNAITGFSATVVSGTKYWIAYLLPTGAGGIFNYADFAASGGRTQDSTMSTLATLADPAPAYGGGGTFANIVRVYATGSTGTGADPSGHLVRFPLGV